MKKEDYDFLNSFFNNISLYMFEKEDIEKYFFDYIIFNNMYFEYFNKKNIIPREIKTNNLSFDDVLKYAREIIKSINKDYLSDFDNLLSTGKIDFSYNKEYHDSHVYYSGINNDIKLKLININREFNYEDVGTVVHEFMHYTSTLLHSFNNKLITEFISIYFELYTNEFLYKNYSINLDELDYDKRLLSNYKYCLVSKSIDLPLLLYSKFGNLNDDSYLDGQRLIRSYNKDIYNENINRAIDIINMFNDDTYKSPLIESHYYMYATLLAFYARNNCNIDDIINLVNNAKYEDLDLFELLSKYNINIDNTFIYKTFDSMDEYLSIFRKEKAKK